MGQTNPMVEVPDALKNGPVLIAVFAILAVLSSVVTAVLLGGGVDELPYALGSGIAVGVVVVGSYVLGRRYGQPHSHAVAQAGVMLGVLLLAAVTIELLRGAGQLSDAEVALGVGGGFVVTAALVLLVGVVDRATSPS